VLDSDFTLISDSNPIVVNAGQQSGEYLIATGENEAETTSIGVTVDQLTFSANDDYVEFGANNTDNVLARNEHTVAFRVRAALTDADAVKYISWNAIEQPEDGTKQYVSNLPRTKVLVYDTVGLGLEGSVSLDSTTLDSFAG
jgi:hypothetical protein